MPSDLPPICQERARLLREYKDAAASYAGRVREMAEFATAGQEPETNAARRHCRTAWEIVETSRLALWRHEADHNCDRASEFRGVADLDTL